MSENFKVLDICSQMWYNRPMSNELDLVREVKIARIFELLVSG